MSDIAKRLRAYKCDQLSSCWWHHPNLCDEAAAEVERLRAALSAMVDRWEPDCDGQDRIMWENAVAALADQGKG